MGCHRVTLLVQQEKTEFDEGTMRQVRKWLTGNDIEQCWKQELVYQQSFSWVCLAIDLLKVRSNDFGPQGGNEVLRKSVGGTKLRNICEMQGGAEYHRDDLEDEQKRNKMV